MISNPADSIMSYRVVHSKQGMDGFQGSRRSQKENTTSWTIISFNFVRVSLRWLRTCWIFAFKFLTLCLVKTQPTLKLGDKLDVTSHKFADCDRWLKLVSWGHSNLVTLKSKVTMLYYPAVTSDFTQRSCTSVFLVFFLRTVTANAHWLVAIMPKKHIPWSFGW